MVLFILIMFCFIKNCKIEKANTITIYSTYFFSSFGQLYSYGYGEYYLDPRIIDFRDYPLVYQDDWMDGLPKKYLMKEFKCKNIKRLSKGNGINRMAPWIELFWNIILNIIMIMSKLKKILFLLLFHLMFLSLEI